MSLTFGSLFAGIGGFDLGFERAGMSCKWQVEIDDYANRVLAKHWPDVHRERDIRECGNHNLESVDVICGGFPCQDISYAGLGAGLDGERSGLFFEAVRVVRELRPRIVVLENVAALLTRGLDRVLGTLAEIGYDAEWHCIPAAAVGAPHIRDRVFVVAYTEHDGLVACTGQYPGNQQQQRWEEEQSSVEQSPGGGCGSAISNNVSNTVGTGARDESRTACRQERKHAGAFQPEIVRQGNRAIMPEGADAVCRDVANTTFGRSRTFRPEDVEPQRANGTSRGGELNNGKHWEAEPAVGRVANGIPARVDRLRGLGNAVVPQVAEWIGRRIIESVLTKRASIR